MSSNYNLDEVKLFYLQIILSFCLIISILISVSLSYNEILKLENKKPIYDNEMEKKILIFNRIFSVLIAIGFVFINIIEKRDSEETSAKAKEYSNFQISAGILNLIASLIVLYIAIDSINNITGEDIINPEL